MRKIEVRRARAITLSLLLGLSLVGLSLLLARPPVSRAATTLTVTSTADAGGTCPGATCTLRQAIATAASGDTINFAAGVTTVTLIAGTRLKGNSASSFIKVAFYYDFYRLAKILVGQNSLLRES